MTNYNSPAWRTFRRVVPFRVRWFLGLPVLLIYLVAATISGFVHGCKEWRREVCAVVRKYPSFWGRD